MLAFKTFEYLRPTPVYFPRLRFRKRERWCWRKAPATLLLPHKARKTTPSPNTLSSFSPTFRTMKALHLGIRILVFALIAVALWFGYKRFQASREKPIEYITQRAERSTIRSSVSASGTLSPLVDVTVGAQVSGRIMELHADFNDQVEKGQLLARIDPAVYHADVLKSEARRDSARAQYKEAEANVTLKKKQVTRFRELVGRDLMAPSELDEAEAELIVAEARARSARATQKEAEAALEQARTNLDFTSIYSPVNGVILSREVDLGQSLAANFETPAIFRIAEDLRSMQVNTSVAEADIGAIKADMQARFYVDAWPNRTYTGKVREVRLMPEEESNVVTYDAVIDVPNEDRSLLPGMTATIDFIIEERENTLHIPNAALRFQPPEGLSCDAQTADPPPSKAEAKENKQQGQRNKKDLTQTKIWILRNNEPTCIQVILGITDGARTEVVSGDLKEDDAVITGIDGANGPKSNRPRRGIL